MMKGPLMHSRDFDEFSLLLDDAYDLIGSGVNKVISGGAKALFFKAMAPYSLDVFRAALSAHCLDKVHGRFTPKPADIIKQIEGSAANDGRPSSDEAWAIALTSRDESDTVIWTQEIAEAFAICSPVFPDEVGARMAFKDAYTRLVGVARATPTPAQWRASLGWDAAKREAAIVKAGNCGLLCAPTVAALLLAPAGTSEPYGKACAQIDAIKKMMADMNAEKQREAALHAQREHDKNAAAHQRQAELAKNYTKDAA
jgi:Sec-independent protein translocase protein TatA